MRPSPPGYLHKDEARDVAPDQGDGHEHSHQGRDGRHGGPHLCGGREDRERADCRDRAGPHGRHGARCGRLLRHAGGHRPAHASRDALHGDLFLGRFRERDAGRAVGGDDDGRRLRAAGTRARAPRCAQDVGQQVDAGQLRLQLPHGRDLVGRAGVRRDAEGRGPGHQHVQALHGLQGRADGERRRDVRRLPPLRGGGRDPDGPCRERGRGGRASAQADGGGQHRPGGARLFPPSGGRRRSGARRRSAAGSGASR
jgi:hypothetical protein